MKTPSEWSYQSRQENGIKREQKEKKEKKKAKKYCCSSFWVYQNAQWAVLCSNNVPKKCNKILADIEQLQNWIEMNVQIDIRKYVQCFFFSNGSISFYFHCALLNSTQVCRVLFSCLTSSAWFFFFAQVAAIEDSRPIKRDKYPPFFLLSTPMYRVYQSTSK